MWSKEWAPEEFICAQCADEFPEGTLSWEDSAGHLYCDNCARLIHAAEPHD
jgi:hypothetical protein